MRRIALDRPGNVSFRTATFGLTVAAVALLIGDILASLTQRSAAPGLSPTLEYTALPHPSHLVWLLVGATVACLLYLARFSPRWPLYLASVLCLVLAPLASIGLWIFPWAFIAPTGPLRAGSAVPWGGLLLLPLGWLLLSASVRAVRRGVALYLLGAMLYRISVQVAFRHDTYRGLWEYPELVIFWPVGIWQAVGYATLVGAYP